MVANFWYYLPIIIFVWFPSTFILTYVMAVLRKDVNPIFPYISDTGTFSPESCIFGQMLNTGAILMAVLVYVRHRQVREVCERNVLGDNIRKRNRISAWFGFSAAIGVTIVGNFQETNLLLVHMFGAFLAFGLGTIWEGLQTWVSFKLYPSLGRTTINNIRLILTIIGAISFIISFIFAGLAILCFKGKDITKWNKEDGGYDFHITSTITEWIVVLCTMTYILTLSSDLKNVSFEEPTFNMSDGTENIVTTESLPPVQNGNSDSNRY